MKKVSGGHVLLRQGDHVLENVNADVAVILLRDLPLVSRAGNVAIGIQIKYV